MGGYLFFKSSGLLFCLATYLAAFAAVEARSGYSLPPYHYYGAERPDGYYGYGFHQPYRPYAYSK